MPQRYVLGKLYNITVLQHYSTAILQYCNITVLQHYSTATLQYCNITVLQYYSTAILQYCNITVLQYYNIPYYGPRQLSRYSDSLRAGRSGDRILVEARFSALVQTGPGAHPASCTMGTGSFQG
jgi:hypothetical protein